MTDCLVYWKEFWTSGVDDDLHQIVNNWYSNQDHFFQHLCEGDNLWVVVWAGPEHSQEWRLLQRISAQKLETRRRKRAEDYRYWVTGDDARTETYKLAGQRDFTPTLKKLMFLSGRPITLDGRLIGRSLRAIRPLSDEDVAVLRGYAGKLERI